MEGLIVFLILTALIILIPILLYRRAKARREEERLKAEAEAAERDRIKECGEVILFYANYLGYIARECITRDELEELIDDGITPDDLSDEIATRIDDLSGLCLGYQPFNDRRFDVKLTKHYRDRHVYIVGKSGSGKTNLIRNMIYQDMEIGNGIGVIAPEAEMITEEIMPYIPEHRIDDVIYFNPADIDSPVTFNPIYLDEGEDIDLKAGLSAHLCYIFEY